jgi:hypothetical protein
MKIGFPITSPFLNTPSMAQLRHTMYEGDPVGTVSVSVASCGFERRAAIIVIR